MDVRSGRALATVRVGPEPRFVAVGLGSAWATSFDGGTLVEIDPRTDRVVRRIDVGQAPQGVVVAAGSVWVGSLLGEVLRVDPSADELSLEIGSPRAARKASARTETPSRW